MKQIPLIIFLFPILLCCSKDEESRSNTNPPESFDLLSVPDESYDIDVYPVLSWEQAKDPEGDDVSYTLILDETRNPVNVIESDIEDTSYTFVKRLNILTTYYWKVIAVDAFGNTTESNVFEFFTRGLNIPDSPFNTQPKFDERILSDAVIFKEKIWIIGGFNDEYKNDVWSSVDGNKWIREQDNASFYPRGDHGIAVFKDKLWVIGGSGVDVYRDVWSSDDGIEWTLVTGDAPFGPRYGHTLTVFEDKLWLIAGAANGSEGKNDVWATEDGVSWTLITPEADFSPRAYHTTLKYDDKMWVICGFDFDFNSGTKEVWSSEDGYTWRFHIGGGIVFPRASHTSFVFDDRMWIIGGFYNGNYWNDMYFSHDGDLWTEAYLQPPKFLGRASHFSLAFKDRIWMHGGYLETNNGGTRILDDIWYFD